MSRSSNSCADSTSPCGPVFPGQSGRAADPRPPGSTAEPQNRLASEGRSGATRGVRSATNPRGQRASDADHDPVDLPARVLDQYKEPDTRAWSGHEEEWTIENE